MAKIRLFRLYDPTFPTFSIDRDSGLKLGYVRDRESQPTIAEVLRAWLANQKKNGRALLIYGMNQLFA
ncbi:hypothetical protein [Microcoleus sp. herbarium2]|uniref:hypothetical protein n=1 Tax=Microcoleus sp. herbarium2 TaxID=3055433 RepID=UPI002FD722E6